MIEKVELFKLDKKSDTYRLILYLDTGDKYMECIEPNVEIILEDRKIEFLPRLDKE